MRSTSNIHHEPINQYAITGGQQTHLWHINKLLTLPSLLPAGTPTSIQSKATLSKQISFDTYHPVHKGYKVSCPCFSMTMIWIQQALHALHTVLQQWTNTLQATFNHSTSYREHYKLQQLIHLLLGCWYINLYPCIGLPKYWLQLHITNMHFFMTCT